MMTMMMMMMMMTTTTMINQLVGDIVAGILHDGM